MGLENGPGHLEFRDSGDFLLLSFCDDDDEEDSFREVKKREKKKTKKRKKAEASSQTTSPVSVLEVEENTDSSSPITGASNSSSSSSSALPELRIYCLACADDEEGTKRKSSSELDSISGVLSFEDPFSEASFIAEEELHKINWVPQKNESFREIAVELGLQILDALILEEVLSLASFSRASETLMLEEFEFSVFTMKIMN